MKSLCGFAVTLVGFLIGTLGISLAAKPANAALTFRPLDALLTCFFSFLWVGGAVVAVVAALVLLVYLAVWFRPGIWVYGQLSGRRS